MPSLIHNSACRVLTGVILALYSMKHDHYLGVRGQDCLNRWMYDVSEEGRSDRRRVNFTVQYSNRRLDISIGIFIFRLCSSPRVPVDAASSAATPVALVLRHECPLRNDDYVTARQFQHSIRQSRALDSPVQRQEISLRVAPPVVPYSRAIREFNGVPI